MLMPPAWHTATARGPEGRRELVDWLHEQDSRELFRLKAEHERMYLCMRHERFDCATLKWLPRPNHALRWMAWNEARAHFDAHREVEEIVVSILLSRYERELEKRQHGAKLAAETRRWKKQQKARMAA